ncbi:MAG: glycosyltransferase family 87 protein [Dysgonomonas sp.]|nr:glycosyltransferase family 87 protein [Dysgonomonas sp.]
MNVKRNISSFFSKPIFTDKRFLFFLWALMAVIGGLKATRIHNNYRIFKGVFYHTLEQLNLYASYPTEHHDVNHYGPFFSVVIAPFALMPDRLGLTLWAIAMIACLFIAIYYLPIEWKTKCVFYYVLLAEVYMCAMNCQTNGLIAALLIGSLLCLRKEKELWAACFIMFGTFIKLYGIVGLAFFFFSKHKGKFIAYLVLWAAIFFVLPMLISSPSFVIQSYVDWYNELVNKNIENITNWSQDISAIGLVRRISGMFDMSALLIIVPGIFLFLLQYINVRYYKDMKFQLGILASTLLFVVLFSTGSEKETYIIALTGVCIWYAIQEDYKARKWAFCILIFTALWTYLTSSHIFPKSIRVEFFNRYALKALPSLVVWLVLAYQLIRYPKFSKQTK